jgi:hypothetical protein
MGCHPITGRSKIHLMDEVSHQDDLNFVSKVTNMSSFVLETQRINTETYSFCISKL